ncbi:MAG: single-stranded-DNA-specific exonuclease RecJ [Nitrospirae bacterium]|nr:single-stranded-DNA-specific exonuclease RecJ [Nitrospirota bacterium]
MHRRWLVTRTNAEYLSYLSRAASISPVFAQVLVNRGIKTVSDIHDFLHPGLTGLSDPFDLCGMREAVERIKTARQRGEKVLVHGDYDADGLTATAITVSALRTAGLDAVYFIPHRMLHGYGFGAAGIEAAEQIGARLMITVDCGIGSFGAADRARERGIDVIITDHHEPVIKGQTVDGRGLGSEGAATGLHDFLVPGAVAVINPKLYPQNAKLNILCGAGIAFKLAQAMAHDRDLGFSPDDLIPLLDLAALGTVADVVPLVGENRIIIRDALSHIQGGGRRGLQALKQAAGIDDGRQIKAGLLSYTLVPRINAAGRIGDSHDVVRLLLSEAEDEAHTLAAWLDSMNGERQRIEEVVFQGALEQLKEADAEAGIVLAHETWHQGVLGIVASRLAETFHRPAFIFSIEDGIAKGSARSIPGFDICRGLGQCGDLLISFGGHKQAAGVKLRAGDLPVFEQRMKEIFMLDMAGGAAAPVLEIHAPVKLADVNNALMKELELLEPYGYGNPEPLLGAKNLEVVDPRVVGSKHLKLKVRNGPLCFDAIGFDMGRILDDLVPSAPYDAAFSPSFNEWNGGRYLQLVLKGLRPSA